MREFLWKWVTYLRQRREKQRLALQPGSVLHKLVDMTMADEAKSRALTERPGEKAFFESDTERNLAA